MAKYEVQGSTVSALAKEFGTIIGLSIKEAIKEYLSSK